MLRQARSSAPQPLRRALVVLLSFVVITCSSPTDTPEGRAQAIKADPFAEASVQATISLLAQAGIATYQDADSAAPLVAVTEPVSPLKLLHEQVRAMALEAHYSTGIEGSQLDVLVDTEPDMAPPSYILAAYVSGSDTAGAKAARTLMGDQDWQQAPTILYPQLVMVLFTADVLGARDSEFAGGPIAGSVIGRGAQPVQRVAAIGPLLVADAGGYCSRVMDWINTALRTVFDALRLGQSSNSVANFFAQLWNTVVALVEEVVTAIVKRFTQVVLDAIGRVAAVVATVANVVSLIRPWTVTVGAAPTEKGIAGIRLPDNGSVVVTVRLDGLTEWPKFAADCARTAGRPLPNLKPEGAQVTWERVIQNPPDLIREGLRREALDANASAQLDFVTLVDQVEEPYKRYPGAIVSRVEIERPGLRELLNVVQTELWQELPTVVQGPLWSILGPSIMKIQAEIVRLVSTHSSGTGVVFFHVKDQPTPTPIPPTATPRPTPRPTARRGTPRPADARCAGGRCASSTGEPHLRTVDGVRYDFMAAGEYVLLRSPDGSLEIQGRQEPLRNSTHVTRNTAIAARVGASRVVISTEADGDSPLSVAVDGQPVDASTPIDLGDGGRVAAYSGGVQVDFPDGTQLWAVGIFSGCCINAMIAPTDELIADGAGLLGNVDPGAMPVPAMPDGTRLPFPADGHERYVSLYQVLGPAWAVTEETTLFDYAEGESTQSFLIPGFPEESRLRTVDDLTDEERAEADALCAEVEDQDRFQECVFDVSISDLSEFVELYLRTVEFEQEGPEAIGAPPLQPPSQPPLPPPDDLPEGFHVVTNGVDRVVDAELAPDGRLYATVTRTDGGSAVLAIDTTSGALLAEHKLELIGQVAVAGDSVWVGAYQNGFECIIVRFEPGTLTERATIEVPCSILGAQFAALGDAVWYLDRTTADGDARGGDLRRIDPATNEPAESVKVGFVNGFLFSSESALFWHADPIDETSPERGVFRLVAGATEFEPLGPPLGRMYPAGDALWAQRDGTAVRWSSAAGADAVVPIEGSVVGADTSGVYVDGSGALDSVVLWRYGPDGAPVEVATSIRLDTSAGSHTLDYGIDAPLAVGGGLVAQLWLVPSDEDPEVMDLVMQAVPAP